MIASKRNLRSSAIVIKKKSYGLVKFTGRVRANGLVHASVTVQDKYAAGSGRLTKNSGQGTWKGHSGSARCSGYWTAQRS
jgi:hypothetical protein